MVELYRHCETTIRELRRAGAFQPGSVLGGTVRMLKACAARGDCPRSRSCGDVIDGTQREARAATASWETGDGP